MRLYLSSYRLGDHVDRLLDLLPVKPNVSLVANALDVFSDNDRQRHKAEIYDLEQELKSLGFSVSELDLRTYFNRSDDLENQLAKSDLIWVLGGNSFVLRRAMALSGFDSLATRLLRSDTIAYGGFSAGAVVAAPTMDGIHLMDDPNEIPQNYPAKPLWEGLGWTDFSIIPHFKSNHPEAENAEATKTYFAKRGMPFRTLKDGEVLLNKGNGFELLSKNG